MCCLRVVFFVLSFFLFSRRLVLSKLFSACQRPEVSTQAPLFTGPVGCEPAEYLVHGLPPLSLATPPRRPAIHCQPAARHSHPLGLSKTPSVAERGHLLLGGWLGSNSPAATRRSAKRDYGLLTMGNLISLRLMLPMFVQQSVKLKPSKQT